MGRVQIFLPCYKRYEYTKMVLDCLNENTIYKDVQFYLVDDGSCDGTKQLFFDFKRSRSNSIIKIYDKNLGLRTRLLEFFKESDGDYICKIDNDCLFPKGWLSGLLGIIEGKEYRLFYLLMRRRETQQRD